MSEPQQLPVILDFGGRRRLESLTRTLGPDRLSFYLADDAEVPAIGAEARFEARIAGASATGRARVEGVSHVDDGNRREMVVEMSVLELHGPAAEAIARATFRERVEQFATKHREGARILEAAGGATPRPRRPDTTPLRPREAHWVAGASVPKSEQTPPPAEHHGMHDGAPKEPGRVRPTRAKRHHWENADRFRLR